MNEICFCTIVTSERFALSSGVTCFLLSYRRLPFWFWNQRDQKLWKLQRQTWVVSFVGKISRVVVFVKVCCENNFISTGFMLRNIIRVWQSKTSRNNCFVVGFNNILIFYINMKTVEG